MTTQALPQPWQVCEPEPVSREEYLSMAHEAERNGLRLVVFTFVNGYPDPLDDGGGWFVDATVVSDWRTGEVLLTYDVDDEEPDLSGYFDVEHRLANQ